MPFKFEKLEIWQLALEYVDTMYEFAGKLPSMSIRSLSETVACQKLILRRKYLLESDPLFEKANLSAQTLARKLHSFRKSLRTSNSKKNGEQSGQYLIEDENPLS
jgi:hypothetical protein